MSENDLIKERFNLIIDHFSTIELDQCIGSVFLQSSIRTISKSYPPFGGIAYLYSTLTSQKDRAQRAAIARQESYWKLNDPIAVGGPLSINDTIPIIDKFIVEVHPRNKESQDHFRAIFEQCGYKVSYFDFNGSVYCVR